MSFSFSRTITVDHTKCGTNNSADFPVAVFGTYTWLRTVANGGQVQNANGYDIGFYLHADATGKLDWEVESYNAVTGAVVYWVKLPLLSATVDTKFYIMYGDASIVTDQSNHTAVWDSHFVGVWHFPPIGVGPDCDDTDSTTFARTSVTNGSPVPGGAMNGAIGCPGLGLNPEWSDTGLPAGATPRSIEFWIQSAGSGPIVSYGTSAVGEMIFIGVAAGGTQLELRTSGAGGITLFTAPSAITSVLHQIVVTFTGTTATFFEDGAAVAGQTNIACVINTVLLGHIKICGTNDGQPFGSITGTMDEFRISNVIRSNSWILSSYNNQFSPTTFYTISAQDSPFTISCGSPPEGITGAAYTHTFPLPAGGGTAPFIYGLLNRDHTALVPEDVLDGIPLNGATRVWSGIPTVSGVFPFSLVVVDVDEETVYTDCTLTVVDPLAVVYDPPDGGIIIPDPTTGGDGDPDGFPYVVPPVTTGGGGTITYGLCPDSGPLPPGLTIDPITGIISGLPNPGSNGHHCFTVCVSDTLGESVTVPFCIDVVISPDTDWFPGDGWTINSTCARQGSGGLSHTADGTADTGTSVVVSRHGITVTAGETLFVTYWFKTSGGADGTVGVGMRYFDAAGAYVSQAFVTSSAHPTSWTEVIGQLVVPADAVTAYSIVEVVGHLVANSVYCVDDLFASRTGGHFILASAKHYWDDYVSYRG